MDIHTIVIVIFYLVILLYSVIIHEVSHGIAALKLGDRTALLAGRLTLNPKSHIDPFGSIIVPAAMLLLSNFRYAFGWAKPVPFNPQNIKFQKWGSVIIALAGPASNMAIAIVAAIIGKILPVSVDIKVSIIQHVMRADWQAMSIDIAGSISSILFLFCVIAIFWNVLLMIFNMLPIPPLDGSKLLYAIVPLSSDTIRVFEQYGFILLLIIIFLFPGPINALLGFSWNTFFGMTL